MKHLSTALFSLLLAALLIAPSLTYAGAQQNKMATCSKGAKARNLAGDERKRFMKSYLST